MHKYESTSSEGSHKVSQSSSTKRTLRTTQQTTMMDKLMETLVGMDKRIQAQTASQTEAVTTAISTAAAQQRIEIIDLISVSSDKLEEKIHSSNNTLRQEFQQQLQQQEQRSLLLMASWDEKHRNQLTQLPLETDDRANFHSCHYDTWIADSEVVGWKELYLAAWQKLNPTPRTALLPTTTATTERGLHHALQRMKEGDLFPCEPVYSAEKQFFQLHTKIIESPIIQDGILGVIGQVGVKEHVYFHYHGTVHYPIEGETACPYSLSICRGQVQLSGATLRDGKTSGPVMLNEYMWNSEENNIEFSENIHKHDIGRMRTNRYIEEGSEWFLEYDKQNKDYDWHDALEYRTKGILANLDAIYGCLSWNTNDQQDEVRWARWLMQQLDSETLAEVLRGMAQHTSATAQAMSTRLDFPSVPGTLVPPKAQLHVVLRIMVEAYQVANGTHGRKTKHNNIDAAFNSIPLHSALFRLSEYQLEQGFKTRRDPDRENLRKDEYFVRIMESMHRLGIYVYNYQTDSRLQEKTQIGYNTRNSATSAVRDRLEKELRGMLNRQRHDSFSDDTGPSSFTEIDKTLSGTTDRTTSVSSRGTTPAVLQRAHPLTNQQSTLKQTTIPLNWTKTSVNDMDFGADPNQLNMNYNPTEQYSS